MSDRNRTLLSRTVLIAVALPLIAMLWVDDTRGG